MNLQRSNWPRVHFSQTVFTFDGMQSLTSMSGRTVVCDGVIAARRAAGMRDIGGRHIVHRDNDEAIRRQRHLIAEGPRIDAHGRAAARARERE